MLHTCLALLLSAAAAAAPGENIAVGKPYTLKPAPDYKHCTDPGDATQLTDGEYVDGYFWAQPGTVGWRHGAPVVIEVDLGEDQAIGGASFNTAAGAAGVAWPSAIHLLVAQEKGKYHAVGELTGLSAASGTPPAGSYAVHRYITNTLRTHGRYVAFVVVGKPYIFCDEVEVYAGGPAWLGEPLAGEPVTSIQDYVEGLHVHNGVLRRLRRDIEALREQAAEADITDGARAPIAAELDAAEAELPGLQNQYAEDFRAVLPLNEIHRRCFRAQAALWRALGRTGLTLWQNGRWAFLDHLAIPPENPEQARIEVHMLNGEYRSAAFNLSNATPEDMTVTVAFDGLPGAPMPPYIEVHEVAWTDTASGIPVASALPPAARTEAGWRVHVPAGLTRQVWLTFHPNELAPRPYRAHRGRLLLGTPAGARTLPIKLYLYPLQFPEQPTLRLGGWDYVNGSGHRGVTPENRDALVAFLQKHFVSAPWATNGVIPKGAHGEDGTMATPPDTTDFDEWAALWPDAAGYYIFAAVRSRFLSWNMDTPEFTRAVGDWARFWAGHAKEKGIDPEKVYLLLVDEPHAPEQDATILAWAKALGEADTGLQIWEDPTYHDMSKANLDMVRACDVLCPNRPIFLRTPESYREYFRARQEEGAALEFYSCTGPARLLDPYAYYRLQAWTCWKERAQAMHFWAFGDLGGGQSAWNEYAAPGTVYTPQFLDAHGATDSKQMAAIREGIEDYELFVLADEVPRRTKGKTGESYAKRTREIRDQLVERVLAQAGGRGFRWTEPRDRTLADGARIQLLKAMAGEAPSNDLAAWEDHKQQIRENMHKVMGTLPPDTQTVPPDLEVLEETEFPAYTRKRITFAVEDWDRLPAYLLIPKKLNAPAPAMLCLHPTYAGGKDMAAGLGDKPNRNYAEELAQRGYVTLAPDYPGFGEYKEARQALYEHGYASCTLKGISNHMRCVDLLQSLPEVDPSRIGCIGHSLGGHNTLFLGAFDERVKVMVTSCGFTSFPKYYEGDLTGWTHDGYMPRIATEYGKDPARMPFDFPEVLALQAPRPVFINAPLHDANFEVSGVRDCVRAAAKVYALYDAEQRLVAVYPDAEHDFPKPVREQAYQFIGSALGP